MRRIAAFAVTAWLLSGCTADVAPFDPEASDDATTDDEGGEELSAQKQADADFVESVAEEMRALDFDDPSVGAEAGLDVLGVSEESAMERDPMLIDKALLPHNQIAPLYNGASAFHRAWQPRLTVETGCVPHVAVDAAGNTNAGLANSGNALFDYSSGCSKHTGQIYARTYCFSNDTCGTMYSWYFPRDSGVGGHRHDFEQVVIWTQGTNGTSAKFLAAAYSGHGSYRIEKAGQDVNFYEGTHLKVKYKRGILNHQVHPTGHNGGTQPLISWLYLPQKAKNALNTTSFGSANCAFNDARFADDIMKAKFW